MSKYVIAAAAIVVAGSVVFGFSVKLAILALVVLFVAEMTVILKRK
jgi:cytidine deaminase